MSEVIIKLAKQAGMIQNEEHFQVLERIGGRGIHANMEELTAFAKLVGKLARESEREKLKSST